MTDREHTSQELGRLIEAAPRPTQRIDPEWWAKIRAEFEELIGKAPEPARDWMRERLAALDELAGQALHDLAAARWRSITDELVGRISNELPHLLL